MGFYQNQIYRSLSASKLSLQDPIGTKENHVGSCRNGVQDPVRDLSKLGLPNKLNPPITEAQNLPEAQKF